VALAVAKAQSVDLKAIVLGHGNHGGGVQATAEQNDGFGRVTFGHGEGFQGEGFISAHAA